MYNKNNKKDYPFRDGLFSGQDSSAESKIIPSIMDAYHFIDAKSVDLKLATHLCSNLFDKKMSDAPGLAVCLAMEIEMAEKLRKTMKAAITDPVITPSALTK